MQTPSLTSSKYLSYFSSPYSILLSFTSCFFTPCCLLPPPLPQPQPPFMMDNTIIFPFLIFPFPFLFTYSLAFLTLPFPHSYQVLSLLSPPLPSPFPFNFHLSSWPSSFSTPSSSTPLRTAISHTRSGSPPPPPPSDGWEARGLVRSVSCECSDSCLEPFHTIGFQ